MREVVLTDTEGNPTGTAEIVDAHTGEGKLHSAFSVYVFRKNRSELLIQKRAEGKLLFHGFWANTCCSHPFPKEDVVAAGERRLKEECGFTVRLKQEGALVYQAADPGGNLSEHEYDSLLTADVNDEIELQPDSREIAEMKWVSVQELLNDMKEQPDIYAPWFHLGLQQLL